MLVVPSLLIGVIVGTVIVRGVVTTAERKQTRMSLATTVAELFRREAQHLTQVVLPPDHISPPIPSDASIVANKSYFRLWVDQMFLKYDHNVFKTWYPAVQSLTTFSFGNSPSVEVAQIAGPGRLNVDQAHLGQVITLNLPLTPLVPFTGGDVGILVGLVSMQASDAVQRFLGVVSSFAELVAVPQLSMALNVASKVSSGVDEVLGVGSQNLMLGFQQTYVGAGGGGPNDLRPCYIAVLNRPNDPTFNSQLWVKGGKLFSGADLNGAQELTGVDYMLLRIETREHRDDWEMLQPLKEYYDQAKQALTPALSLVDDKRDAKIAEADLSMNRALGVILSSPDLTDEDRFTVLKSLKDHYAKVKDALSTRALRVPQLPTLTEIAEGALEYDSSPVAPGDVLVR